MVRDPIRDELFFSDPATRSPVRTNLSLFSSQDSGASWRLRRVVDEGAAAYSALQVLPGQGRVALLNEGGAAVARIRAGRNRLSQN